MDRASAAETVDLGLIPGRVKSKTLKIGIHSFPAWRSAIKATVKASAVCGRQKGPFASPFLRFEDQTVPSLPLAKAIWWMLLQLQLQTDLY